MCTGKHKETMVTTGRWVSMVVASDTKLQSKWSAMMSKTTFVEGRGGEWPQGLVCSGNAVQDMLGRLRHTPEWVIVDGGALHGATVQIMKTRHLKKWGVRGTVSVWGTKVERDEILQKHEDLHSMANILERTMQRALARAYSAVGGARFKTGVADEDFREDRVLMAMAADPTEEWGELRSAEDWCFQLKPEWPAEPSCGHGGDRIDPSDGRSTGVEVPNPVLTPQEVLHQAKDRELWVQDGQSWEGAFLPSGWKKVKQFLNENKQANETVAGKVLNGKPGVFGDVRDLCVEQVDLRPGARGSLWDWTSGVCRETVPTSIADEVGYNISNVLEAARLIDFQDERSLQMLTEMGSTHGTEGFPLHCYAARNHQGAAARTTEMTDMVQGKEKANHLVVWPSGSVYMDIPWRLPFGIVPVNGNVQYPGEVYEKVRGVWDGSSPHDGSSPNDACELYPEENPPWVTIHHVVQGMCVLLSIGVPVQFWKLDCKAAYCQLIHQVTQRWRQFAYWRWYDENEVLQGGYFNDCRMMWGMRISGGCFYRTISTITVRWVTYLLIHRWMPKIRCPITKKWVEARLETMSQEQSMPACVQAFLDDFWISIASGHEQDMEDAYKLVMWGFEFLGWTLSMSKFEQEGKRKPDGIILGHAIDLVSMTRAVTEDKKLRVRKVGWPMLDATTWSRIATQKLVGLLQSIKDDVVRRWRLGPMYAVVYAPGDADKVYPSTRARECLRKALCSLNEQRSLFHRPTRWQMPAQEMVELVPNGDACTTIGYGGVMIVKEVMQYFVGRWTDEEVVLATSSCPHISVLEAWTTVMMAFTWGHLFQGRKVVLRSDSKTTCAALNKLSGKSVAMSRVCDLWEDIQFMFGFEGLVVFLEGKKNRWADIASRVNLPEMKAAFEEGFMETGMAPMECVEIPVVWSRGDLCCGVQDVIFSIL